MTLPQVAASLLFVFATIGCGEKAGTAKGPSADPGDVEFSRRIVGTWETVPEPGDKLASDSVFRVDGTGYEFIRSLDHPNTPGILVTLKWSIEQGMISFETVESDNPQAVPIGVKLKSRIISLSDEFLEYELTEGYGDRGKPERKKARRKSDSVEKPVHKPVPLIQPMEKDWIPEGMQRK